MRNLDTFVFASKATGAAVSNAWVNTSGDTLTLTVSGSASAFSFTIQGISDLNGSWENIFAISIGGAMSSMGVYKEITEKGFYACDISGFSKIRTNITSVTGGDLTIFGKMTNSGEVY